MDNMSMKGGAAYLASRNKDGGHKRTDHSMPTMKKLSPMNKSEMKTVKKDESKQMATRMAEIKKDPKEEKIFSGLKSSKKLGGK